LGPDVELADDRLAAALESLLLVAGGPVTVNALASAVQQPRSRVLSMLRRLGDSLKGGIRLQIHDGEAQLVTAPENVEVVQRFLGTAKVPALSRSALEALTIVAYRQPVTRPEVEAIRGVNSERALQTLVARGLIEERGRRETIGRPVEFGTTMGFLEYFGLTSLEDLPPIKTSDPQYADAEILGMRSSPDAPAAASAENP
jgi:segregation and condensation protein B